MTDEELDVFFVKLLNDVLKDLQECAEYTKNLNTPEYIEINEDYADSIACIRKVISTCSSIDDLAEQNEETIDNIYEYLASYSDNFIISAYEPQKSEDMKMLNNIEELLFIFLDDEDFEDEEI